MNVSEFDALDYDVVVVGAGLAGHCAALTAADAGASVLMLEAAPRTGGATRLSTGIIMGAGTRFQMARGIMDSPQSLFDHYISLNQWRLAPSVIRALCDSAGSTIEWLADMGIEITDIVPAGEEATSRAHVTRGGAAIMDVLEAQLQKRSSIDVVTNTRVDNLVLDQNTVRGVYAGGQRVKAGSVVLCVGGAGANLDIISQYQPAALDETGGHVEYVGPSTSRGDGVTIGLQVGAQIFSARGSRAPASVLGTAYLPSFAVLVNQLGRRFQDETLSYGIGEAILSGQPGSIAYLIFDEVLKTSLPHRDDLPRFFKVFLPQLDAAAANWSTAAIEDLVARGEIDRADTLAELARRLGIPPENLQGTLERYNTHVRAGCDRDYCKDAAGLRAVSTPPFYATAVKLRSFGLTAIGPRVDQDAAVLHRTGRTIAGLYAAGECAGGIMGDVYVGSGASLASAAVFGRIAGKSAVSATTPIQGKSNVG